jgi:PAS domain S-box-containing protein
MSEITYYAIAFVITVAVSMTLAAVAWRRRSVPGSTYFALMMLSVAWWAFSYAMEALSEEQTLWVQLSTLGDCTMPVFFMLFALSYWRPDIRIRLQYQILIWLIPVATIIIALTNGLHGFLLSEKPPSVESANILLFEHGPWFYVTMIYDFLTMWVGVVFLFRAATSLSKIYRRQALIVLVAAVIPWIANALFLFGFSPVPGLNIAPIMASVTGLLLAFGIVKFQLFKVLPIAKEVVYKQIENGVLVVNSGGIIVDINPATKSMLGGDVEVGQKIKAVLTDKLGLSYPLPSVHQRTEASLDDREKPIWLDVVVAPLYDRHSQLSGHLIMLHDISDRKSVEELLRHSEERFRQFIELLPEAVCEIDTFGNVLMANKRASLMSGYDRDDLENGLNIYAMIAPEDQGRAATNLQKKMARESLGADEYTLVRKDGSKFPALVHISDIVKDGKTIGFRCVIVDITERKKAEEAQHRLAVIVESSHDAILSRTPDGIITTWNKGAEMLYGYTAEEVIGHPESILIPPEFAGEEQLFIDKLRRGEAVRDYEALRITRDGKRINVLLTISPIKDTSGRIIGASSIAQNITEIKRAAEVLKESEKKYRELFENANEAIFVAQDARIVFTNPMLIRMFGYSAAELSAKLFIEFIYPDDRDMVIDRHRKRLAGEELPPVYAFRVVHRDGEVRWVELSAVVIEWLGKPATLNFLSDITARKQAEEALRQSEQKFKDMAEQMPQTIFEIDLEGHFIYANRYGLEFHGYTVNDMKNDIHAIDFFIPEQRQKLTDNMAKVLRGEETDNHEYSVLRKDGSTYPALIYSNAIVRDGQPVGIRGIIVDITERKKAEQMKSDFVSFISHQLRTPTAGLMGYIDNMLDGITGDLNSKQAEYLSEMRDVCARNNQLIADLLNISRLERGVIAVDIKPVYLRDKVEMAVREYKTNIEEKGLALNVNEVEQGVSVLADGDKLVEVLKNVIHNAYKFTKDGSINVEISSEGNQGVIKVRDTGVGMTESVQKDLFKKEKVFGGAIAVGGGAGLGLYIAKGFMKLQGGDIVVESVVGKGSTFIISLPKQITAVNN